MKRLFRKYLSMPEEMKAAVWYTFSNIIQKAAPWLVMIILTHTLSTSDYGVYSVFLSWLDIFEIIITLRIYSSGYVAGLVREDNNKYLYSATMQTLSFVLVIIWLVVYLVVHPVINKFTDMSTIITVFMIISFFGTVSFGLWSSRKRVENKYKSMLVATLLYGVLGPVVGALSVFLNLPNPIMWVVAIRIAIQCVVSIPFIKENYKGTPTIYNRSLAVDAMKYNLPLLPYYLSMVLLNHSDRLMIQKYSGYSDAAVYSVAYSASMMISVVSGALNLSLQAWLFKALKENKKERQTHLILVGTFVVAACCLIAIILAPEIIFVLGGSSYLPAIWVMPPVIISVLIMFIYQQYVNILFYYKKTKLILLCSVLAAFFNIVLNSIFIPCYGYVAAGYTTFASYLLVLILYYFMMIRVCSNNNVDHKLFFDVRLQTIVLFATVFIAIIMVLLYEKSIIRYVVFGAISIVFYVYRNKIIAILREG